MGLATAALHALLKFGQVGLPTLLGQLRVLLQLPHHHQLLDPVDGVDVVQTVLHDPPYLGEALVGSHHADGAAVNENVRVCQQLQGLDGVSTGAQYALTSLDELFFTTDEVSDLDDIASDPVLEDLNGLGSGNAASKQLDEVSGFENCGRIVCLECCLDRHASLDEVERACDAMDSQGLGDLGPGGLEVDLTILGK